MADVERRRARRASRARRAASRSCCRAVDDGRGRAHRGARGAAAGVYTFGNGGSSVDAQHFAEELVGRFKRERRPLPAQSLASDAAALTCIANDYSFEEVFERQVRAFVRRGRRRRSRSRRAAARRTSSAASRRRARRARRPSSSAAATAAPAAEHADHALVVPSDSTARIQEMHVFFLHCVIDARRRLGGRRVNDARPAHDRQRAHRPGVAVAVAGGLPGGARDLPVRDRPAWTSTRTSSSRATRRSSSRGSRRATPSCFERIRERIAEGRFQVVGGWWVEPDCNIPGGESFVRQALYGQRYLRDTFGITATTGANLDSFGHNATIPQILRKSGCDSYVFLRPGPSEKRAARPALLVGVARRLARARLPDPARVLRAEGRSRRARREGARVAAGRGRGLAVFYGVGNHGGGPTKANLDSDRAAERDGDCRGSSSARRALLRRRRRRTASCRSSRGELQHHARGCYTTHSGIKRWNRRAENLLQRAEKWCAVADALGAQAYPLDELTRGMEAAALQPVPRHARRHVDRAGLRGRARPARPRVVARRERVQRARCSRSRARSTIEQEDEMRPVVVFNPHPWPLRTDVELEYTWTREQGASRRRRRGRAGADAADAAADDDERRCASRFVFPVDVPPLGYRTYRIRLGAVERRAARARPTPRSRTSTCCSSSTRRPAGSRGSCTRRAAPTSPRRAARTRSWSTTSSDTWGHGVAAYDQRARRVRVHRRCGCSSRGPVRAIVRVESRWGDSTLREDYVLGADCGLRRRARRARLARAAEAAEAALPDERRGRRRATFETPYGHLERPASGDEEPGQSWVDVSGGGRGLAVINDAKYGYDVRGGDIGISAVRSPVWAWHAPRELEHGRRLRVHGPGPADLPRPARPARGRLARGGCRPPRRGAQPAAFRADRDVPRRARCRSGRRSPRTAAATSSSPS